MWKSATALVCARLRCCRFRAGVGSTEFSKCFLPSPQPSLNRILLCFGNWRHSRSGRARRNRTAHRPPLRSLRLRWRNRKPRVCSRRRIGLGTWQWLSSNRDSGRSYWASPGWGRSRFLPWRSGWGGAVRMRRMARLVRQCLRPSGPQPRILPANILPITIRFGKRTLAAKRCWHPAERHRPELL